MRVLRVNGFGRALALSLPIALAVSLLTGPTSPAFATSSTQDVKAHMQVAESESAASMAAIAQGTSVVVNSLTSTTQQVVALPDGTFELTVDTVPVRVEQNGEWVPVSTDLSAAESGFFAPEATTVPVEFAPGGGSELARIQLPDGSWLTETWPLGTLPIPEVDGPTAIYRDVIPDVDLRLTATADGMTEVFVIHNAEAAADPRLENLEIGIEGATATSNPDGSTTIVPEGDDPLPADQSALRANRPQAWDSSEADSGPDGPAGRDVGEAIPVSSDGDSITLDVSALVDVDVTYPIYVDPDWTGGQIHAWYVNATYPNQVYLDGGAWTGPPPVVWDHPRSC